MTALSPYLSPIPAHSIYHLHWTGTRQLCDCMQTLERDCPEVEAVRALVGDLNSSEPVASDESTPVGDGSSTPRALVLLQMSKQCLLAAVEILEAQVK